MLELLINLYLPVALIVFCFLLAVFMRDASTPKTDLASWAILVIATILWPVVVPISGYGLLRKRMRRRLDDVVVTEN